MDIFTRGFVGAMVRLGTFVHMSCQANKVSATGCDCRAQVIRAGTQVVGADLCVCPEAWSTTPTISFISAAL